ncbi:MFS transporter [Candidatus Thorarchaeota archaeon]|nr:MAG: MFS transporter [Candidatus Thorarchaeota archaeon]
MSSIQQTLHISYALNEVCLPMKERSLSLKTVGSAIEEPELETDAQQKSLRSFAVMWGGQAVSLFGSRLVRFAVIWWITLATGSATVLATASIMFLLPQIIVGPFAGSYVDRWNRKRVMMVSDTLIAATIGILALLFYLNIQEVWHIYLIMLVSSFLGSFHFPAMQASTTLMVPEEHYSRIGGINQSLQGVINVLAPPIGAVLYVLFPLESILAIDIVTAFFAVVSVAAIHIPQPEAAPDSEKQSPLSDMADGLRFLKGWTGALLLIVFAMILNLIATPAFSLLPLLVINYFGGDATTLAFMQSAFALGMVTGGAILGIWGGTENRVKTGMGALAIQGAALFFVGTLPSDFVEIAFLLLLVAGFMNPIFNGSVIAIMQATIPPEMQGRVFSLIISGATAMTPIGLAFAGPVADAFGVPIWFIISGLVTASLSVSAFFVPSVMNLEKIAKERASKTQTEDENQDEDVSQDSAIEAKTLPD